MSEWQLRSCDRETDKYKSRFKPSLLGRIN